MSKQETPQKSFRFSEDTIEKINCICKQEHITQSFLFAKLIDEYYIKITNKEPVYTEFEKNSEQENILKKLKIIENDTNKKMTMLLDIMNSFISNGIIVEENSFVSFQDDPHAWFIKSKELISQKITESQYKGNV